MKVRKATLLVLLCLSLTYHFLSPIPFPLDTLKQALTSYMPALKTIVQHSSQYRSSAAQLLYQCLHIKSGIAEYFEGTEQGVADAEQAVTYAKESGIRTLYISALRNLAACYYENHNYANALLAGKKAAYQLKLSGPPVQPLIQSWVHTGLLRYQAKKNQSDVEISRKLAYDTFGKEPDKQAEEQPDHSLHSYANLLRFDAMAHLYMKEPLEALKKFEQILDFGNDHDERVKLKLIVPARHYGAIVNEATLVSLKVPNSKKDKKVSIRLWKAGIQAAREFHNERLVEEAIQTYEIMEGIWSGETDVLDLGDLIEEYEKGHRPKGITTLDVLRQK